MGFEGVVFDMDGTLVDSEIIWQRSEHAMFERRGLLYDDLVRALVIGLRLDEFFEKLRALYGLRESTEELIEELVKELIANVHLIERKPGAQEMIDHVASLGVPFCIASSSPMVVIEAVVRAQGWENTIRHLYSADVVALGKPAPDVYLYACEQLGVTPSRCLALEDSPNGARAAAAAGLLTVAVPDYHSRPEQFREITPHVYGSLHEVLVDLKAGRLAPV